MTVNAILWKWLRCENSSQSLGKSVVLRRREMWSATLRAGQTVTCTRGVVWLTQSGDATDYILRAGERFTARSRGRVVAQAREYSLLCIEGAKARRCELP